MRKRPLSYWSSRFATSRLMEPQLFCELVRTNISMPEIIKGPLLTMIKDNKGRLWFCQAADTMEGFQSKYSPKKPLPRQWWLVPVYGPINPAIVKPAIFMAEEAA